jgi:hypothetical protein
MNDIQSLSATAMALGFLPLACTDLYGRFGRPATTQIQAGGFTGVTRSLKWFESARLVPEYGKHRAMRMTARTAGVVSPDPIRPAVRVIGANETPR